MKTLIALAAFAATALAAPALAANNTDFVGPRVGIAVGSSDVGNARDLNNVNYTAVVGLDAPVGSFTTVGVEADITNFASSARDFGFYGRIGVAPTNKILVYVKAGVSNFRNIPTNSSEFHSLNGYGVGGGVQYALTSHVYVGVEGLHNQYSAGIYKNSGAVTAGIKF